MAVLVIWASPNPDGLTAAAKDSIVEGIEQAGGTVETVSLNSRAIERCRACNDGWGGCKSKGQCVIADDFYEVYQRMCDCDGIVFVTPVYWHDLAENLKSFLDRLRRCEASHNHFLKGKKCLLAACAGGSGNGATACLQRLEETLNHMGMTAVDRLPVIRFNRSYMLPALKQAGFCFAESLSENQ